MSDTTAVTVYTVVLNSEGNPIPFNEAYRSMAAAAEAVREHAETLGYTPEDGQWEDRDGLLSVCTYNNFGEVCEFLVQACTLK